MKKTHPFLLLLFGFLAVLLLLPIVVTVMYSFFSSEEIRSFMDRRNLYREAFMEIKLIPRMISLDQYETILIHDTSILHYYMNSLSYAALVIAGQMIIIPALAYALSRYEFPFRDVINFVLIILFLLPFQVTMVSNVLTLRSLGLMNTRWAIILPEIASPFYVFLLRQYMVAIPGDMFEAAQMDGAGPVYCYCTIAIPVSVPILSAAAALSFADCWNLVEQPLAYLTKRQDLYPLSLVFNQLTQKSTGTEFAGAALYLIPALCVYLFFQDNIISGIQLTELK